MSALPRKKNKLYMILGAVIVVAAAGYWYVHTKGTKKVEDKPLLAKVEMGSIENTIAAAGGLKPFKYVDVGAQVSGQLQKLYVQVGDIVKQGQLLAEIDAKVQQAKVEASRAGLAALQAQVDARKAALVLAKANAERQQRLNDANATSKLDYDTAMNNLASAQSALEQLQKQIDQSQASLRSDETQLDYTKIYAPVAGTVVTIDMIEGRTLNAVQMAPTILRIADLSTMTVEADISEADISNIKVGMTVYFTTLGGGERRWYSKVRQILPTPTVTNNVVLYTGLFDVDNSDGTLFQEMTSQVYFVTASAQNVLTVPVGALKFNRGGGGGGRGGFGGGPQQAGNNGPAANGSAPLAAAGGSPAGAGAAAGGQAPANLPSRRNGRGPGGGGFPGGGGGGFAGLNSGAPRPATVVVMKDDGTREERQVMIGVQSRVSAEVISGLTAGEQVVAGIIQSNAPTTTGNQNNNRNGFQGGFPGGGFGGRPF